MKFIGFVICVFCSCFSLYAQKATVNEFEQEMTTYPFSDPDPVPRPDNLYYPYFRFDGFSAGSVKKKWKTVELDNPYIRVTLFPEIGGGEIWAHWIKPLKRNLFIRTVS